MILSAVALPITIMFFLTGALYIGDIKPHSEKIEIRNTYDFLLEDDLDMFMKIATEELRKNGLPEPLGEGEMEWNKKKKVFQLYWSGRNCRVILRPSGNDAHIGVLSVKIPGWYSQFMSLHKGKGKDIFDYFIIASAVMMLLILLSGVVIGLSLPKFRNTVIYSIGAGSIVFLALAYYSQYL